MSTAYDLVVIGAGSAGLTAAGLAVQFGVRVVQLLAGTSGWVIRGLARLMR